ncbi:hypothetical protein HGRIS_002172 [Hohenbuehelia grisea]|uniref:FAD-binding domain-containing protein n=1 Tax=Hohenbuehelia grisea TaxID=104357 RepID=A0ABR3JKK2_9AGAR
MFSPSHSYARPPNHAKVLIIGGGPAGTYAASALAREGIEAVVVEAAKFPRYHVGESLLPSARHYLRFIGAEEKLSNHGFRRKPGSAIKFNQFKREGYTDFVALGHNNNAWNVVRSEFDHMLMNHARASGASVYELTKVNSIEFSSTEPSRPVSVCWTHTPPPAPMSPPSSPVCSTSRTDYFGDVPDDGAPKTISGATSFDFLIDATGRNGILSTRYFKNRNFTAALKNIAVWGYWRDVETYGLGTPREGSPWFEALTDESGWAWFIPLHNGTTSVGVVMNQEMYNEKHKANPQMESTFPSSTAPNPGNSATVSRYLCNLKFAPGLLRLIGQNGKMVQNSVHSASDFSYSAPSYAGMGYRIIGDAGAFIDPFFSSGIHLAMTSALSAAATICAAIRNDCSEFNAANWHTKRVATSYTRFQVVVLSAYKQIRAQSVDILSDIDEDNYDRAFAALRPVIQGASDMGARLSERELQKSLDFCVQLFNPTSPEQHKRILHREGESRQHLLDVTTPVIDPHLLDEILNIGKYRMGGPHTGHHLPDTLDSKDDDSTRLVAHKINARRVVHPEYAINNLESESLDGLVVRLERGDLGLRKAI